MKLFSTKVKKLLLEQKLKDALLYHKNTDHALIDNSLIGLKRDVEMLNNFRIWAIVLWPTSLVAVGILFMVLK